MAAMSTSMDELIAKLEEAPASSRALDIEICVALGQSRLDVGFQTAPHYTSSIDAALSLVPDGAVWMVQTDYGGLNRAHVNYMMPIEHKQIRPPENFDADAENPAIALCIAALKARAYLP